MSCNSEHFHQKTFFWELKKIPPENSIIRRLACEGQKKLFSVKIEIFIVSFYSFLSTPHKSVSFLFERHSKLFKFNKNVFITYDMGFLITAWEKELQWNK